MVNAGMIKVKGRILSIVAPMHMHSGMVYP